MTMSVVTLAERPDLAEAMWRMENTWPRYMLNDPVAEVYYRRLAEVFPEYQLVMEGEAGVVAKVNSIPFVWAGDDDDLPERGWDAILERGFGDREAERPPTAVSLLEARVASAHRGSGLSADLLRAARTNVRRLGMHDLFGPVRPTGKSVEPRTPMPDYVWRTGDDGLPADPWIRVHVRLGARIVKICPLSMTIPGTLRQWREWTGLPLEVSGVEEVTGALVPVHVSVEHDHAVYIEPNVWMHHDLRQLEPIDESARRS